MFKKENNLEKFEQ